MPRYSYNKWFGFNTEFTEADRVPPPGVPKMAKKHPKKRKRKKAK